ncbi:MAG: zinc-binding dehydrogenase, partial [Actinomycetota bacterium]|nr:zinc-binding dehydrogenase [Actinomycetota bacterium]
AVRGAALRPGDTALVLGPGTIGVLVAMFARAAGATVHVLGVDERSLGFARALGFEGVWREDDLPDRPWDAVIDASNAAALPAKALDLVEPGGRVVYIGLAGSPSVVDTRTLVLKDVTAVGILSASGGLAGAIEAYATGAVDPRPLVATTIGLGDLADVLAGTRPADAGPGPKTHIDVQREQA